MASTATVWLALLFAVCVAATWLAGNLLSSTTDVLDTRLGFGEDIGGIVLLAVAGSLPELAITISAATSSVASAAFAFAMQVPMVSDSFKHGISIDRSTVAWWGSDTEAPFRSGFGGTWGRCAGPEFGRGPTRPSSEGTNESSSILTTLA